MKTKNVLIVCVFICAIIFASCLKKGIDDPSISFHSRKSRVVGEWKATSYKWVHTWTFQGNGYSEALTMNGGQYTFVVTDAGGTSSTTGLMTFDCIFEKDGKYNSKLLIDIETVTRNGIWNFTSGIGDVKNKTQINLYEKTNTASALPITITGNYISDEFDIIELRNKKMILHQKISKNDDDNGNGPSSDEYDITFEQ